MSLSRSRAHSYRELTLALKASEQDRVLPRALAARAKMRDARGPTHHLHSAVARILVVARLADVLVTRLAPRTRARAGRGGARTRSRQARACACAAVDSNVLLASDPDGDVRPRARQEVYAGGRVPGPGLEPFGRLVCHAASVNAAAIALKLTPSTTPGLLRSGSPIEAASSARRLASAGGGRRHSGLLHAARRRAARAPA